jgi:RHS repeat-associated protein
MSIQRQVEKGLPGYDGADTFTFQGEELVELSDGTFRVENESGFMRLRRVGEGWEIHDKTGRRYLLGASAEGRVQRPGGTGFSRTFRWLLESVTDVHGNRMEYRYVTYPDSPGERYCSEIRYALSGDHFHAVTFDYEVREDAFSSYLSGFEIRTARRCREIAVVSDGVLVRRYALSYTPDPLDPVERVPVGDVGSLFSLLRKVVQWDNRVGTAGSYLPPLRFGYTRMDGDSSVRGTLSDTPPYSLGNPQMALADINADGLPDLLHTDPDTGRHSVYYNLGRGRFGPATDFVAAPTGVQLGAETVQLVDVDGDGRIDLLEKFGGPFDRFVFHAATRKPRNPDDSRPSWESEATFETPFPGFDLADPAVRSLDLDNDKRMDFLRTTLFGMEFYLNRTNRWETRGLYLYGEPELGDLTSLDAVEFSRVGEGGSEVPNELIKLADMNGDRLLDLVRVHAFGTRLEVTFWPNQGGARWGARVDMTGEVDLGTLPPEDAQLRDINGDGLADVVIVGPSFLSFWVNRGNGGFSDEFRREGTPDYIRGETVLQQADINGNGSTDFLWERFDRPTGTYVVEYIDLLGDTKPNLLQVIDNGIGLRTEIGYRSTTEYYLDAREAGLPWQTRLPFPSVVVGRITKRLGLDLDGHPGLDEYVSELSYRDGYYDDREKEFRGFAFAKKVERGDDRYSGAEAIPVHSPGTVTRFAFHTGAPDGIDNDGNQQVDEGKGASGYEEEPLKGRVLWTEVTLLTADVGGAFPAQRDGEPASNDVVFTRESNTWRVLPLHTPVEGFAYRDAAGTVRPEYSSTATTRADRHVRFAFGASTRKEIIEANGALRSVDPMVPSRPPRQIDSSVEMDPYGNPLVERSLGENSPGSTLDDERHAYHEYGFNLEAWILGVPVRQWVTDEAGEFVSETRNFYDGAPFTGLPLGGVGARALLHRVEQRINGTNAVPAFGTISKAVGDPRLAAGATVVTQRLQHDAYGNLVTVRDALHAGPGQGHEKAYEYDPVFHVYVEREVIRVGGDTPDLVATASYDRGAGVMTGFVDFNGNATSFQYDSFWRLTGIVKPGDTADLPTARFAYTPGDPFRGLRYAYDATGTLSLRPTADVQVVNAVVTWQREQSGSTNVFTTVSFTDGGGHKLGTLHESDVAGEWIAKDFKRFSSQGEERKAFLPFVAANADYSVPGDDRPHVASFYDAAGRVFRSVNPPESEAATARRTETRTVYLPLETHLFDEEDIDPASPYFNTPHIQAKDGLDRLIRVTEVTRLNDDGTRSTNFNAWATQYAYDLNDNLTHITDSQGNEKWFRYDGLKRKLFMNDPDRGVMEYVYDEASNLKSTLDARGQRITYAYDGVNRLLSEDYLDAAGRSPDVRYFYDTPRANVPAGDGSTATARNARGMLAFVQDLSGEEHTSYDARGRVEYVVKRLADPVHAQLVSFRTAFAYDSLDRVTTLTYPDSDQVGYHYNARNLLKRISGGPLGSQALAGRIISNITYRASDQLTQIDYGNGVRTTYDYDPRLRLNSLLTVGRDSVEPSNARQLLNFTYEFDGVSNIKAIRDQRPGAAVPGGDKRRNTQLFQYDDLYRITRAQYSFALPGAADASNGFITYRYDRIGNMLNQSSDIVHNDRGVSVTDLGTMNYGGTSGRQNRLGRTTAEPGPHALTAVSSGNRAFPYDANGNMTVIDGLTNTWDFKDRLIQVADTNMVATYTYDYTDRRVAKRVAWKIASTNNVTGLTNNSVLYPDKYFEVRESDAPVKYVWNGNTRVARVTGSLTTSQRTQRLRVFPGQNLVSLAVSLVAADVRRLILSDPSLVTSAATIESVQRWNAASLGWVTVTTNDALAAGTVLWLHMSTNATLTVTGTYAEPANQALQPGVNFIAGWGLQPLKLADSLPVSTAAWKYDVPSRRWAKHLIGDLQTLSEVPAMLAPGDALFARPEVVSTLTVPESALQVRYYHQDHLGSSSVLTDAAGALVSETANYAFGFARNEFLPRDLREPYQFTQKERDRESGSDYLNARYLSTRLGKFASYDPRCFDELMPWVTKPQNRNPYAYAVNRPLLFIDPTGAEDTEAAQNRNEGGMPASNSANPSTSTSSAPNAASPSSASGSSANSGQGSAMNIDQAVGHLNRNATATSRSDCGKAVRQAIQAGGISVERTSFAKDMGQSLRDAGFTQVIGDNYVPQPGDVVIWQPTNELRQNGPRAGTRMTEGHAQMWNGSQWISDFRQTNPQGPSPGFYPGPSYQRVQPSYSIYRPPAQSPQLQPGTTAQQSGSGAATAVQQAQPQNVNSASSSTPAPTPSSPP